LPSHQPQPYPRETKCDLTTATTATATQLIQKKPVLLPPPDSPLSNTAQLENAERRIACHSPAGIIIDGVRVRHGGNPHMKQLEALVRGVA